MVHDHWRESAEEIVDECGLGDVLEGEGGCAVVTSSRRGSWLRGGQCPCTVLVGM